MLTRIAAFIKSQGSVPGMQLMSTSLSSTPAGIDTRTLGTQVNWSSPGMSVVGPRLRSPTSTVPDRPENAPPTAALSAADLAAVTPK